MKKVLRKTTILTDAQVRTVTKRLRDMLTQSFPGVDLTKQDPETTVRMMALSAKCREAREKRGLSIKEIARRLRIPQYRIKAIEESSMNELKPDYLRSYIEFLGLKRWVRRWIAANSDLARRFEINDM